MFRFIMMLVQVQNDDDESDRHTIEGGGCKGKCNYWQTGACSCSVMISYHCIVMAQVVAKIQMQRLYGIFDHSKHILFHEMKT